MIASIVMMSDSEASRGDPSASLPLSVRMTGTEDDRLSAHALAACTSEHWPILAGYVEYAWRLERLFGACHRLDRHTNASASDCAYFGLAYSAMPVKSMLTTGSSPTTQPSWPGGITKASPGPSSSSVPSSILITNQPEI